MAQLALGVVGGVVGFVASGFNPYGAAIGFSVGMSVGSMFVNNGLNVQGNTLGDIAKQTSKEGVARPIIWGRVRPIAGNLIACSEPKIVKEKHSSGGKGGGGATTTSESVYRTYAIRVCEGPITRFVRIWRNNELVYDNRPVTDGETIATSATTPTWWMLFSAIGQWGEDNNAEFLKNGRLYLGDWDQMPDSALEGIFGAGNVPPHRGTAYMVMDNELLNDTGGAVPQWTFEVERMEGVVLTSKPYAVESSESAYGNILSVIPPPIFTDIDYELPSVSVSEIILKDVINNYDYGFESEAASINVSGVELKSINHYYGMQQSDLYTPSITVSSVSLDSILISYNNYAPESETATISVTGASLT